MSQENNQNASAVETLTTWMDVSTFWRIKLLMEQSSFQIHFNSDPNLDVYYIGQMQAGYIHQGRIDDKAEDAQSTNNTDIQNYQQY